MGSIPILVVLYCLVKAVVRHFCYPKTMPEADDGGLQSLEMEKPTSGSGGWVYPASMYYEKLSGK